MRMHRLGKREASASMKCHIGVSNVCSFMGNRLS